ncbi:Arginyl-tRNA--protein transferase 1 [Taenia crassiceps]|uniref:arginyltransferase n=1 Tax=Taenia crassiceps TaxID=6207 RepID=A0ABR4Q3N2_9CEST
MEGQSSPTSSLVELEGRRTADSCRYCGSEGESKAWYFATSRLRVDDYELLMKRGWRRRGMQVRKPLNDITCCPGHPIWCDAMNFKISRQQKRAISVLEDYLRTGLVPGGDRIEPPDPSRAVELAELSEHEEVTPHRMSGRLDVSRDSETKGTPENIGRLSIAEIRERRRQLRAEKNRPKELEDYMMRVDKKEGDVHTIRVRVYKSSPQSPVIKATLADEYKLFDKYLTCIHKSTPGSMSREEFVETYINSSLVGICNEEVKAAGAPQFGTYHHQYWLDGNRLIAVGVVDLVPNCLSSVYFFNDPRYTCLNLGTFSALWEIAYVRNLQRVFGETVPAYADMKYYTMGYYVHSSIKMNYKAAYSPSFLACPETHVWVPIEQCQYLLDEDKYSRLAKMEEEDSTTTTPDDEVMIQLPFSESLAYELRQEEFEVEGELVVTTLAAAKSLLFDSDMGLIREWIDLVKNTGNMRIVCNREILYATFLLAYVSFALLNWSNALSVLSWLCAWGSVGFVCTLVNCVTGGTCVVEGHHRRHQYHQRSVGVQATARTRRRGRRPSTSVVGEEEVDTTSFAVPTLPDEEVVPTTEAVVAAMHAVPPTDSTERWWREWNAQRLRKFASPSLLPPPSSLLPPLNSLISFRTTAPTHIELSEELGSQHFGRAPVAEECKVRDAEDEVEPSRPYADIPHSDARLPPNASSSQNLPRPPPSNQSFRAVDPTMPTLQLSHPSTFSAAIITPSPHSKRLRGPPQQLRPTPSHITPVLI